MLGAFANNEQGVILYQYDKNIGFNKGLLLDYFTSDFPDNTILIKILENYYKKF